MMLLNFLFGADKIAEFSAHEQALIGCTGAFCFMITFFVVVVGNFFIELFIDSLKFLTRKLKKAKENKEVKVD